MKRLLFITIFLMPTLVFSDVFTPSHSCLKPFKPYRFTSQWELDNFNEEVKSYGRCISEFVEESQEAAANHQQAAEQAIDEWNYFINYEL